jgi:hypothetical protein
MTRRGIKFGPEDIEQVKLINWARHTARLQTDALKATALQFFHAIPAGGGRGRPFITRRGVKFPPLEAVKLKATGVTAGINDLFLPYVCRDADGFILRPGLIAEMKAGKNRLSPSQSEYQVFMREQGFAVFTWWHWWVGALDIAEYMALSEFLPVMTEGTRQLRVIRNLAQLERYRLEV